MRDPCIPVNATFQRYGSSTLYANTWRYVEPGTGSLTTLSVTRDTCIPLVLTQYLEKDVLSGNSSRDMVLIYSNVHIGVKNRNVFNVPQICNNKLVQKPYSNLPVF